MVTKQEVINALITTIELSLDSLLLILTDGTTHTDLMYHRGRIENVGKSLTRLESIISRCGSEELLTGRMGELQAKYEILASKVTYKRIA